MPSQTYALNDISLTQENNPVNIKILRGGTSGDGFQPSPMGAIKKRPRGEEPRGLFGVPVAGTLECQLQVVHDDVVVIHLAPDGIRAFEIVARPEVAEAHRIGEVVVDLVGRGDVDLGAVLVVVAVNLFIGLRIGDRCLYIQLLDRAAAGEELVEEGIFHRGSG